LQEQILKEENSMPKLYPEELDLIDEEKKTEISIKIENLKNIIAEFHANNGGLSCRNNNIEKEIV
jgi:hypothetical protein